MLSHPNAKLLVETFNTPLEMRLVFIAFAPPIISLFFQYSIGDACHVFTADNALNMKLISFQYSIGDATTIPKALR